MDKTKHIMPPDFNWFFDRILEIKFIAYYLIVTSFGFIAPIKIPFVAICFLAVVDMLTALCYTYKKESKDFWDFWQNKFTSDKMTSTVWKMILYASLILSFFIAERFIFVGEEIVKPGTWLIAAREVKSIIENVDKALNTNLLKGITDIFSKLFSKS